MANIPTQDNNPGDLKDVGQAGANPASGGFASFSNPAEGFAALANDIQDKINTDPNWNLGQFASVYAPPSDNNDTASYTAKLANQLGVPPTTTIGELKSKVPQFAQAIASNEGYQGPGTTPQTTPSPQTPQPSDTPNLDSALGIGGLLTAGGLTAAALLQGGADPISDVAAGAADTAEIPEAGSWLSKGWDFLTGAAKTAATGAVAGEAIDAITGGAAQGGTGATQPTPSPATPSTSASEEAVTPNPTPMIGSQTSSPMQNFEQAQTPQQVEQQIPIANQNSAAVTQGMTQILQNTAGGTSKLQDPLYVGGAQAMGRYGLQGTADENNRYDATGTDEKSKGLLGQMDDAEQSVLQAEGNHANVSDGIGEAGGNISRYTKIPDQEAANGHAQDILRSYAKELGDKDGNISLAGWHRIAKEQGSAFDRNATNAKNEASKAVSNAAKKVIEKNTYHKDWYKKMQKEKQNIIYARKLNKFLQGKKVPKSKGLLKDLLKSTGKFAGIYLGDKIGGPVGAIMGDMIGEKVSRAADKRFGRNIMETKGMKVAMAKLKDQSPAIHARLEQELKKAVIQKNQEMQRREAIPKLPAPATQMGPRTGENKSIVVGGKFPPASFAQAENRKRGKAEYGGLQERNNQIAALRKMITPRKA